MTIKKIQRATLWPPSSLQSLSHRSALHGMHSKERRTLGIDMNPLHEFLWGICLSFSQKVAVERDQDSDKESGPYSYTWSSRRNGRYRTCHVPSSRGNCIPLESLAPPESRSSHFYQSPIPAWLRSIHGDLSRFVLGAHRCTLILQRSLKTRDILLRSISSLWSCTVQAANPHLAFPEMSSDSKAEISPRAEWSWLRI